MRKIYIGVMTFFILLNLHLYSEEQISLLVVNQTESENISYLSSYSADIYSDFQIDDNFEIIPYDRDNFYVEMSNEEDYLNSAKELKALFLIVNTFSITDDQISISSSVTQGNNGSSILNMSSSGASDLGLDRKISFIINRALKSINALIADSGIEPMLYPDEVVEEPPLIVIEAETLPTVPADSKEESLVQSRKVQFILGVNGSPFIPVGLSADYLSPGGGGELFSGAGFDLNAMYLQVGLSSGITLFNAQGDVNSSSNILVSLEPAIQLYFFHNHLINFYISLNAGITIFNMKTESDKWKTKIIPSLNISTGVYCNIGHHWGLYAGLDMPFYFESSLMIVSLEPKAGVQWRF